MQRTSGYQHVRCFFLSQFNDTDCDETIALAGASATIASDALMNPFDGEDSLLSLSSMRPNWSICF
jgi:hypothetical protein